jgi:hypothetical protein
MARANIVEQTEAEAIASYTDKFFRRVYARTPAIPAGYDGKYVLLAAIAINIDASEAQMDQFETDIEAITGVHKAFVLAGPARIPLDRVPVGHDLRIGIEAGFHIDPPEPEV